MAASRTRKFTEDEALALLSDDEDFDEEQVLSGESEDEFMAEGDFLEASGGHTLVPDNLLAPESAALIALATGNEDQASRDSLLLSDSESADGKLRFASSKATRIYVRLTLFLESTPCW